MVPLYVACIVEGQGDFNAAPVLLKRLVKFVNPDVYADVRPFKVTRSKLVLLGELERAVELAGRGLRSPGVVLIVVDSDDDCPKELAPVLLDRATRSEEHTSELQSLRHLVCRLLLDKDNCVFLNNPSPPEIYTLSLHAALPICADRRRQRRRLSERAGAGALGSSD